MQHVAVITYACDDSGLSASLEFLQESRRTLCKNSNVFPISCSFILFQIQTFPLLVVHSIKGLLTCNSLLYFGDGSTRGGALNCQTTFS